MGAFSEIALEQDHFGTGFSSYISNASGSSSENHDTERKTASVLSEDGTREVEPEDEQMESDADAPDPSSDDSSAKNATETEDEDAKRKAHEEAEAKRKAEWEARFAERRAKESAERSRVAALSDENAMMEAMKHVSKGFERLTRRNMKDMVSEYIQTMCLSDPAFARNVMEPRKSMINCVKYINNKAREYIKKEMEDNDMKPENGMYGGDVPDDVVYQWAVDYFNDPNAPEDEVPEEKFVPKPYYGKSTSSKKKEKAKKAEKKAEKKPSEKKPAEKKTAKANDTLEQFSLLDALGSSEDNAA